jgi:aminobenzoyl-glutamate utilization protein B
MPETCYRETASVAEHISELNHQGFKITENLAGIPTAVMGEAGEGGQVIAFLGEYDALSGLSQQADIAEPRPVEQGGNGHGCGHNMLGAGAMLAAIAVRDWLAATGTPGRVRYIGCPAEEGGSAKTFMVGAGVFDDVDIAITWHPGAIAQVMRGSSLAAGRLDFTFTGRASHAAASPHLGRSAFDGVEMMSVGVNYMREHMSDQARVHYAYLDAGGTAPNVVQARAKVRYVVREPSAREMVKLVARVQKIARGAALMSETEVDGALITVASDLVPNRPLCDAMQKNLDALGPPAFTADDHAYGAKMQATMTADDITGTYALAGMPPLKDKTLGDFLVPSEIPPIDLPGSTDVGDVSWVVPTVQLWGANYAIGTPFHSWQMVAQGKGAPAIKGMIHAAKVMAATGVDAFLDPALIARARADLNARLGDEGYIFPLPENARPPIDEMT